MTSMLAEKYAATRSLRLPSEISRADDRAGPAFFATHTISELKAWHPERLRQLGALPFPMWSRSSQDHFEVRLWAEVLGNLAGALEKCSVVTLVAGHARAAELDTLQLIFHHHTGKPVEIIKCFAESGPGHVWSSTDTALIDPELDAKRVMIVLGSAPPIGELYRFRDCVALFINEHAAPAMFDRSWPAYVAPMSTNGWSLSHIAYRRLLDIETELSFDPAYSEMFDYPDSYARPLCLILAELLRMFHQTTGREQALESLID